MKPGHIVEAGAFGVLLALVFFVAAALADGCYAHTPAPSCAVDSFQQGCLPPVHDERADGGR